MCNNYKFSNQDYINELLNHNENYHFKILDYIKNNVDFNAKILDYGCGTGNLVKILNELGYTNVTGVDLDADTIKTGRFENSIQNIYCLDEYDLINNSFELVLSQHVIEHVENPTGFLKVLSRLIQSQGSLVVVTPNYLNPKNYLSYIKSKVLMKKLHLKPFNNGGLIWLFLMFVKSLVLVFLKIFFKNKYLWRVTPLSPDVSFGGDADATWVSNYLDISIQMRKLGFIERKKVGFLDKILTDIYIGIKK